MRESLVKKRHVLEIMTVSINAYSFPNRPEWVKTVQDQVPAFGSSSASSGRPKQGRTHRAADSAQRAAAAPSANLGDLSTILLRRWPSILSLTLVASTLAAAYLWTTPPTYSATTTLFIDPRP